VAAVDFDGACRGEPAVDVGRFMASLTAKAVEEGDPAFDALAGQFIDEYEARSGTPVRLAASAGQIIGLVYRAQRLLARSSGAADSPDRMKVEKLVERVEWKSWRQIAVGGSCPAGWYLALFSVRSVLRSLAALYATLQYSFAS
jgi:hypothetical protein